MEWAIIGGVSCSLLASVGFFGILQVLKPDIQISEHIACQPCNAPNEDGAEYRIKILNRSRRAAVDVRISAFLDKPRKIPGPSGTKGGAMHMMEPLPLRSETVNVVPGRRRKDPDTRHAFRTRFIGDLEEEWGDDQTYSIVVRIFAKDGWSGTVRQFQQVYPLKTDIVDGVFEYGDSLIVASAKPPRTRKRVKPAG